MSNLIDVVEGANLLAGQNYNFVEDRFGNLKSSIYLNGGYLTMPKRVFNGEFSVTVWIKLKSFVDWYGILEFGNGTGSHFFMFNSREIRLKNNDVTILIHINGSKLYLNKWYHLAFVFTEEASYVCKWYINGILNANGSNSDQILKKSSPTSSTDDANVDAVYSNLKIYNGALEPADVTKDYQNSINFISLYVKF